MRAAAGTPLSRAEIDRVLAPLEKARPLPARAFIDDGVYAFEQTQIFGRAWLCVGREDEVALPGQWLREAVAGEPILVVRGPDLRLRAFLDVCRHRGASLVGREPCGRTAKLECPYHGWTYELDGRLVHAPFAFKTEEVWRAEGERDGVPVGRATRAQASISLHNARVDTWRGFVFVTLDAEAPALESWLGQTPPWLTSDVLATGQLKRGRRVDYTVAANWKLLVENFQESHHFTRVHQSLERLTPTGEARSWLTEGPWLGGTMDIEAPAETVSMDGSRHGRPLLVTDDRRRELENTKEQKTTKDPTKQVFDAMLFPALFTSLQPDYLLTYRLVPLATNVTRIVADIYFHPAAFVPGFDPRDVFEFWDGVNAEDKTICQDQQANASSNAFDPACYVSVEEGMHAFDRMVAKAHLNAHSNFPVVLPNEDVEEQKKT